MGIVSGTPILSWLPWGMGQAGMPVNVFLGAWPAQDTIKIITMVRIQAFGGLFSFHSQGKTHN